MKSIPHYLLAVVLQLAALPGFSQELFFCQKFYEGGEPADASAEWFVSPMGGNVFCGFRPAPGTQVDANQCKLKLYYLDSTNTFLPYDLRSVNAQVIGQSAVHDLQFCKPGMFKLEFISPEGDVLATEQVAISLETDLEVADYPAGFRAVYAAGNQDINNSSMKLPLSTTQAGFKIGIGAEEQFGFSSVFVQVHRQHNETGMFSEFIGENKYTLDPSWKSTVIPYTLKRPGHYEFRYFNPQQQLLGVSHLEVAP